MLPLPLRVKPFVISMEDIKLEKGLYPSTIEIERFNDSKRNIRGRADGDENNERGESVEVSFVDVSQVIRNKDRTKSIEIFSGEDPMFNCKNLGLRIKSLERKHYWQLALILLLLGLAIGAVLAWFKIFLKNFITK